MDELADVWSRMIASTLESAKAQGRTDIVEYLKLKHANDELRVAGVKWLFDSFRELAAQLVFPKVEVENSSPHYFVYENARMVGAVLRFTLGVRKLEVEAGWTRTPKDGFMRNQALAVARLNHFGLPAKSAVLILKRMENDSPSWFIGGAGSAKEIVSVETIGRNFEVFLNER